MNQNLQTAFENLREVIEQEVTKTWRPVTEKPRIGERILVRTDDLKFYCYTYSGYFFTCHTHWMRVPMPLPEMPNLSNLPSYECK